MSSDVAMEDELVLPCGQVLANRFAKAAMTECLASPALSAPTKAHVELYRRWSRGGAGLLITGNVMVDRRYREAPRNVVVEDERDMQMLLQWSAAVRSEKAAGEGKSSLLVAQISHPGRQCPVSVTYHPVAPSAVQVDIEGVPKLFCTPRPLENDEILAIIERFATTARVLQKAGFDGVQIHSAHGYLISQFLSPHVNRRTDEWGGSAEKRRRFLREIVRAVRAACGPKFIVAVKINSADFQKGGFTEEESMQVIEMLGEETIDLVEISGGTYENSEMMKDGSVRASTRKREAFFLDFAEKLRERTTVPVMVTGGFRTRKGIEEALASGAVDVIGQARPYCLQPDMPALFMAGTINHTLEYDVSWGPKMFRKITDPTMQNFFHQRLMATLGGGQDPSLPVGKLWCMTGMFTRTYVWDWAMHPFRNIAIAVGIAAALLFITSKL